MLRASLLSVILVSLLQLSLRGDLIVDIKDSNIVAGGVGWVDVEIYATTGSYEISFAQYEFALGSSNGFGSLELVANQELSEQSESSYLFFEVGPTNNFSADSNDPVLYSGGDWTDPIDPNAAVAEYPFVNVSNPRKLLVRLDVMHIASDPSSTVGATFTVEMLSGAFQDKTGNLITFDAATNSSPGIATITAVPEPSSLLLIAGAGGGWLAYRKRRSKPSTSHNP